jgi:hypothetical protein
MSEYENKIVCWKAWNCECVWRILQRDEIKIGNHFQLDTALIAEFPQNLLKQE